jgi:hypothetical protein
LTQEVKNQILKISKPTVVSVGGFGPVDREISSYCFKNSGKFITFDIDNSHAPQILGDICKFDTLLAETRVVPDIVIALEVLEHVFDYSLAIEAVYKSLKPGGIFIVSTPWIIPIHDRPNDFHRLTPQALIRGFSDYSEIVVTARGNYFDSVIMLLLRGLFIKEKGSKLIMLIGVVLSSFIRKPKLHSNLKVVDSCIGYLVYAKK